MARWQPYGPAETRSGFESPLDYRGYYQLQGQELRCAAARVYDPELRQFLSKDPLAGDVAAAAQMNRRQVFAANPIRFTDPLGLQPEISIWAYAGDAPPPTGPPAPSGSSTVGGDGVPQAQLWTYWSNYSNLVAGTSQYVAKFDKSLAITPAPQIPVPPFDNRSLQAPFLFDDNSPIGFSDPSGRLSERDAEYPFGESGLLTGESMLGMTKYNYEASLDRARSVVMSRTLGSKLMNYTQAAGWALNGLIASALYTVERPVTWGLQGIGALVEEMGAENLDALATSFQQSSILGMEAGTGLRAFTRFGVLIQARAVSAIVNATRLERATERLTNITRLAVKAEQGNREAIGLLRNYSMMEQAGWSLVPKSFTYGSNWGLDAVFTRQVRSGWLFNSTEYAALESKASGGLSRLQLDKLGIQQGSWDYISTRLERYAATEVRGFDLTYLDVWLAQSKGAMRSYAGFGDRLYELDYQRIMNASQQAAQVVDQ